jgi:hypothetical protein
VVGADGDGHLGLRAAVAQHHPVLAAVVLLRHEHAPLEGRGPARVDVLTHRVAAVVVLVLAVLPVQQL